MPYLPRLSDIAAFIRTGVLLSPAAAEPIDMAVAELTLLRAAILKHRRDVWGDSGRVLYEADAELYSHLSSM